MTDGELTGQVALVTGGSRGIGAAIADSLAAAGADIAISARTTESLTTTRRQIESLGRACLPLSFDVTSNQQISHAVAEIERELGPIDILINNAGVNIPRTAIGVSEDEWSTVLDTNLKGPFLRPGRREADDRAKARPNCQCRLGRRVDSSTRAGRLLLEQGRADHAHARAGAGVGGVRHNRERRCPDVRRDGARGANAEPPRDARVLGVAHPDRSPGDNRRCCGRRPLPGVRRGELRHRYRPSRRWRSYDALVRGDDRQLAAAASSTRADAASRAARLHGCSQLCSQADGRPWTTMRAIDAFPHESGQERLR
ncbi:MAG: SDR family NAD(P)-dependent oxidoreductase [Thermomicrobiales bacterium]|nr:SDR family NAD(P)-dependent oxidoreductase [Thermomicrobiales bacterium]